MLVVAYTGVMFIGTGALSLWTPEESLIYRRTDGVQQPITMERKN
jgi:hypothetical protein